MSTYNFPCSYLLGAPYPRNRWISTGLGSDERGFGDQHGTAHGGAFCVMFCDQIGKRDIVIVGTESCKRCEDDTMLKRNIPYFHGREKLGLRHDGLRLLGYGVREEEGLGRSGENDPTTPQFYIPSATVTVQIYSRVWYAYA